MPVLRNQRHELFCHAVVSGLSATQAYSQAGYSAKSADANAVRLMANESVAERIKELKSEVAAKAVEVAIASRDQRVKAQDDRWQRMRRLLEARAVDLAAIPGGNTGLLVRQVKSVGFGDNNQLVDEYVFDAALMREMRELEKMSAQELGQWAEKRELTGKDGAPVECAVTMDLSGLTDEELAVAISIATKLAGPTGGAKTQAEAEG